MAFTIKQLNDRGAAEVLGLDCARPLAPAELSAVQRAFLTYPVLAIRDQRLDPAQQVAFSRQFGEVEGTDNSRFAHPDEPLVLVLSNEVDAGGRALGIADAGDFLHSDLSTHAVPSKMTILHSIKKPSHGGETEFVNTYHVYAALPQRLKDAIAGRSAYHHASKLKNPRVAISGERPGAAEYYRRLEAEREDVLQPMVRTHPETGRQALYVSPRFTLRIHGMEPAASEALLGELFAFMREPRFLFRYCWRDNDLLMWDNRCVNHRATGGYVLPDVRRLHRTSVAGDAPFYRAEA